jgi:hypothetical protein
MLLVMTSSAVVSVTMFTEGSKLIVSPSFASASAWRSEPGPLSFPLVTVMVVAARFPFAVVRCASANKMDFNVRVNLFFHKHDLGADQCVLFSSMEVTSAVGGWHAALGIGANLGVGVGLGVDGDAPGKQEFAAR